MDRTNAERQRRYIARLKALGRELHSPDMVLAALSKLKPMHLPKGYAETFAMRLVAEAKRLCPGVSNVTQEFRSDVTNTSIKAAEPDRRGEEIVRLKARIAELEATVANQPPSNAAELEAELTRAQKERNDALDRYWDIRAYLELRTEGVFTRAEFNKVRALLHPDKAQGEAAQKRHAEAFDIFSRCEKLLKKEPLPKPPPFPTTREEMMAARLRVLQKNRARGRKAAATRARKKPGRQLRHNT
jgi:hypothetical protein